MATSVSLREPEPVVKPLKAFKPGTVVEIIVAAEARNVLIMEDFEEDGIYTVDLEDFSLQIMDGDLSATEVNAEIILCGYARH
jgi:hypothetical protein